MLKWASRKSVVPPSRPIRQPLPEVNMPKQEYLTVEHPSTKELTRIFSQIQIDSVSGCWNWTGAHNGDGYGFVGYKGRNENSHRLMYAWLVEPIPRGWSKNTKQIDHFICDNPPCCNPAHLRLVTQKANALRSRSPLAINAKKTHCPANHPLPVKWNYKDGRRCKACKSIRRKAKYHGPRHEEFKEQARQAMRKLHGYKQPRVLP